MYSYQKGNFETMRKDALRFAKEKYFNGHSDVRSVQANFNLITSADSADKHILSKISWFVSMIPWITPEIKKYRFAEGIKFMLRLRRQVVINFGLNLKL